MALAGLAPVNGSYTPIPFDSALPSNDAPTIDKSASALPATPDAIREMQARGRSWLHAGNRQTDVAAPSRMLEPESIPMPASTSTTAISQRAIAPDKPPRMHAPATSDANHGRHPTGNRHLHALAKLCSDQIAIINRSGEARPQYAGALFAVQTLSNAVDRQQKRNSHNGPAFHADAAGSLVVPDVDEAGHSMYAAFNYLKKAFSEGFGSLGDTLTQDASLWAHDPKAWLTQSAMPHGGADVAVAGIITTALVPFALLALRAGISEMQEAKLQGKALALEVKQKLDFLDHLNHLSTSLRPNTPPRFRSLVEASQKVAAQHLSDLKHLQQSTRHNARIGLSSAASGAAIATNTTLGLCSKIAAVPPLAATVGTAATLAVGPAAAVFAVTLGAGMAITSDKARKNFTTAAEPLKKHLANGALDLLRRETAGKHDYLAFLSAKLDQRTDFYDDYAQKNKRFLYGSSLYAGSTIATCGLTAAALLGAGISIGPIGIGALLVAGAIGGLIMGRNSSQFLFGHGRMHRYQNASVGKHPELDRDFQNILDTLETLPGNEIAIDKNTGMALRADIYWQASMREEMRQDFLSKVAADTETRYHQVYSYSTDSEDIRAKRGGAPTVWRTVRAVLQKKTDAIVGYSRAGLRYLRTFLHSRSHAQAKAEASQLRQEIKPYLSIGKLQDWLHSEENHPRQIAFMHDSLSAQIAALKNEADLLLMIYRQSTLAKAQPAEAASSTAAERKPEDAVPSQTSSAADTRFALLDSLAAPLARDHDLLDQMETLQTELKEYMKPASAESSQASRQSALPAETIMRFLSLQRGKPYDSIEPLPDIRQSQFAFADYTMNEAMGSYRNLRGMLVDVELQARRLEQRNAPRQVNPQSGA